MALMAYPNFNAIHYKGFGGFNTKEECEGRRAYVENILSQIELDRGTPSFFYRKLLHGDVCIPQSVGCT